MKAAIVGSRGLHICNMELYLPAGITEIVSGGATGVDTDAAEYAKEKQIPITVFLPDYRRYGKAAPLKRNLQIIDYADIVIIFWDGYSRGTAFVIEQCRKTHAPVMIWVSKQEGGYVQEFSFVPK